MKEEIKKDRGNKLKIRGLDRVLAFAMIIIVNPTAFLRFGGRRQFFYL